MKNEPAFPISIGSQNTYGYTGLGLTKLEYFAAMAMQGIRSNNSLNGNDNELAQAAFDIAEAMLKESEKRGK